MRTGVSRLLQCNIELYVLGSVVCELTSLGIIKSFVWFRKAVQTNTCDCLVMPDMEDIFRMDPGQGKGPLAATSKGRNAAYYGVYESLRCSEHPAVHSDLPEVKNMLDVFR